MMMMIEGVLYRRFIVHYHLLTGQRRRKILWSPGYPWIRTEAARYLDDAIGIENIKPRSVSIRQ